MMLSQVHYEWRIVLSKGLFDILSFRSCSYCRCRFTERLSNLANAFKILATFVGAFAIQRRWLHADDKHEIAKLGRAIRSVSLAYAPSFMCDQIYSGLIKSLNWQASQLTPTLLYPEGVGGTISGAHVIFHAREHARVRTGTCPCYSSPCSRRDPDLPVLARPRAFPIYIPCHSFRFLIALWSTMRNALDVSRLRAYEKARSRTKYTQR